LVVAGGDLVENGLDDVLPGLISSVLAIGSSQDGGDLLNVGLGDFIILKKPLKQKVPHREHNLLVPAQLLIISLVGLAA